MAGRGGPFFFVGTGKNAGKTTLLNAVNRVLSGAGASVGVTTIGHDGEAFDAVLGHPKPPVILYPGNLACMTEAMAENAGSAIRVVLETDFETAVGRLVIARALIEARVEILGPETNARAMALCEKMEDLGAGIILVDGAFSRRTQIAGKDRNALALIVSGDIGATLRDIEKRARHWIENLTLPRYDGNPADLPAALGVHDMGDVFFIRGPLTDESTQKLIESANGRPVIVEDGTKMFCSLTLWERLKKSAGGIYALRTFDLALIAANPTARCKPGFDPAAFARTLRKAAGDIPVIDVLMERAQ